MNIGCSVHFIPLHLHPCYSEAFGFRRGDFPNPEWVYEREVSLPLYPKMSTKDVWDVMRGIRSILNAS